MSYRRWHPARALFPRMIVILVLVSLTTLLLPPGAQAQVPEQCFAETEFCIRGPILDYWQQYGGLATFGYPLTELRTEITPDGWTIPVQWFQRARLEDRGVYGIVRAFLGGERLGQLGYNIWDPANRTSAPLPDCEYVESTAQNICEPFRSYWRNHGGAAYFGLPLTGPRTERVGDWEGTVQYFEYARMQHIHDGSAGPEEIVLSDLGYEVLVSSTPQVCAQGVPGELRDSFERIPFRRFLGCPRATYGDAVIAVQPFERGRMLWMDLKARGRHIVALSNLALLFQQRFDDTWTAAEPVEPDRSHLPGYTGSPPDGRLVPQHGFGKVWSQQTSVRDLLRWATAPEQHSTALVQEFDRGWLAWFYATDTIYAFGPNPADLVIFQRPSLTPAGPTTQAFLAGQPAPVIGGELVVRTQSVDFYRSGGSISAQEIRDLSSVVEEIIASGATLVGTNLQGRVALRFEPSAGGSCPLLGVTYSERRTIYMYYSPGSDRNDVQSILAHELIHQLQHDYYGWGDHQRSDNILLEGMAVWASSPYERLSNGDPAYQARVKQALRSGQDLSLTRTPPGNCRTPNRASLYDQWGSFTAFLLETYGRERYDALYRTGRGRGAGSSNYSSVYSKDLGALEQEWRTWVQSQP